jgi:hypothetical protein
VIILWEFGQNFGDDSIRHYLVIGWVSTQVIVLRVSNERKDDGHGAVGFVKFSKLKRSICFLVDRIIKILFFTFTSPNNNVKRLVQSFLMNGAYCAL